LEEERSCEIEKAESRQQKAVNYLGGEGLSPGAVSAVCFLLSAFSS
jgi:hypothetical protein